MIEWLSSITNDYMHTAYSQSKPFTFVHSIGHANKCAHCSCYFRSEFTTPIKMCGKKLFQNCENLLINNGERWLIELKLVTTLNWNKSSKLTTLLALNTLSIRLSDKLLTSICRLHSVTCSVIANCTHVKCTLRMCCTCRDLNHILPTVMASISFCSRDWFEANIVFIFEKNEQRVWNAFTKSEQRKNYAEALRAKTMRGKRIHNSKKCTAQSAANTINTLHRLRAVVFDFISHL